MSQPMLATASILKMTASQTAQWVGMFFVMHLVYSGVLESVVNCGLRSARRVTQMIAQ